MSTIILEDSDQKSRAGREDLVELRVCLEKVLSEPVPERLKRLVEELKRSEHKKQNEN